MGRPTKPENKMTPREELFLRVNWDTMSRYELARHLPGRNAIWVKNRLNAMGLKRRPGEPNLRRFNGPNFQGKSDG